MTFLATGRAHFVVLTLLVVTWVAGILTLQDSYYLLVLSLVAVWAVLGLSWNILGGYGGLISFGHAAFFCCGAYSGANLSHDFNITPWIGALVGGISGALVGVIVGSITFRLKGHYFSLAMLAYPLALMPIFSWAGWDEVSLPLGRNSPA